jgi:hypothetical protein
MGKDGQRNIRKSGFWHFWLDGDGGILYNYNVMKIDPTMTAALLKAIKQSGQSRYSICKATGLNQAALGRFVAGKQSLRLDMADKLAAHLGLQIVSYEQIKPAGSEPKTRKVKVLIQKVHNRPPKILKVKMWTPRRGRRTN